MYRMLPRLVTRLRSALLLLAPLAACGALCAQTITIRLLDAKSGKPLPNRNITFQWDDGPAKAVVALDKDGIGHVDPPAGTSTFILIGGPNSGNDPHRIAYANCNGDALDPIPVSKVVATGLVPQNICTLRSARPTPGEVVFWASPRSSGFLGMN